MTIFSKDDPRFGLEFENGNDLGNGTTFNYHLLLGVTLVALHRQRFANQTIQMQIYIRTFPQQQMQPCDVSLFSMTLSFNWYVIKKLQNKSRMIE